MKAFRKATLFLCLLIVTDDEAVLENLAKIYSLYDLPTFKVAVQTS